MRTKYVICALMVALLAAVALNVMVAPAEAALFKSDKFEDNVVLAYSPVAPVEYQKVNVSIYAKDGVPLVTANLWVEIKGPSYTSSGAYGMTKINSSARFTTLNGYSSNTNVSFYVTAYDGVRELKSKTYYYTVAAKNSWKFPTFEQNVALEFGPNPPEEGQVVNITVESQDLNVRIARADINVSVTLPGFPEMSGAVLMNKLDDFTYNSTIPQYPGGTVVKFQVKAYDDFWTQMSSKVFEYTVKKPAEIFLYGIYVVVFNNITHQYVKANVSVYDGHGYYVNGQTTNGIFWTPTNMTGGWYTIKVDSQYGPKTQDIYVPKKSGDDKFIVYYSLEDTSTGYENVRFPTLKVVITALMVAAMFPIAFLYLKDREKKRVEAETKKKDHSAKQKKKTGSKLQKIIDAVWKNVDHKRNASSAAAFAVLGLFATTWCPFYPWWMVLILAGVSGAIGYRFPYLALLFLSFVSIGSTAYQSPQFGLLFMIFALVVSICALFNWKFGYLSFLTVFLSTFGLSFLVPVFAVFLFSLFVSMTVTVVSGVFLSVLVATGNFLNLSFIVTSGPKTASIVTFSRSPESGEYSLFPPFSPESFLSAVAGIRHVDLFSMGSFIQNYMSTMIPLIQVAIWCIIVLLIYLAKRKFEDHSKYVWAYAGIGFGLLMIGAIGGMLLAEFPIKDMFMPVPPEGIEDFGLITVYVLNFFLFVTAVSVALVIRDMYSEYYTAQSTVAIGTRISDMMSFRRTTFDNVGGLKSVKTEIKNSMIGPLLKPEFSKKFGVEPPKGIILFGPPGCGKTLLMRVIATELEVEMIGIKCSDIMSKWYGESENLLADLFRIAKERKPCILFLDEIDAIAKRRDFYSADDVTPRLLSIMLTEMDGMDESAGVIIIGATNKPELIDPALLRPGRFDKVIYVPPPDMEGRMGILNIHLRGKHVDKDVNLKEIAILTEGYSGADLANLVRECATNSMTRAITTKKDTKMSMRDFREMIEILKPSLTTEMKNEYEQLKVDYERKTKRKDLKKGKAEDGTKKNFSDIGGMKELKEFFSNRIQVIKEAQRLMKDFKISSKSGILLFGPPGNGKRSFVNALANEHSIELIDVHCMDLKNDLAKKKPVIKELFNKAKTSAPCIIHLRDLHELTSKEALANDNVKRGYHMLMKEIDSLKPQDRLIIIATSTKPHDIDPLIIQPNRFERLIHVGLPDIEARAAIFNVALKEYLEFSKIDTMLLALRTEGYSGQDIFNVVNEAKMIAIQEAQPKRKMSKDEKAIDKALFDLMSKAKDKGLVLTFEHLLKAIVNVQPTTSRIYIKSAEKFITENSLEAVKGEAVSEKATLEAMAKEEKKKLEEMSKEEIDALKQKQAEKIKILMQEEEEKLRKRLEREKAEMERKRQEDLENFKRMKEKEMKATLTEEAKRYSQEMRQIELQAEEEKQKELVRMREESRRKLREEEEKLEKMKASAPKAKVWAEEPKKSAPKKDDIRKDAPKSDGGIAWDSKHDEEQEDEDTINWDAGDKKKKKPSGDEPISWD